MQVIAATAAKPTPEELERANRAEDAVRAYMVPYLEGDFDQFCRFASLADLFLLKELMQDVLNAAPYRESGLARIVAEIFLDNQPKENK